MPNAFKPPPMDPALMAQMGMGNPFASPPPSPTLGFGIWAQDPRKAMLIQPSMTDQDKPLQAGSQMAAVNPPTLPPMASARPPQIPGLDPVTRANATGQNSLNTSLSGPMAFAANAGMSAAANPPPMRPMASSMPPGGFPQIRSAANTTQPLEQQYLASVGRTSAPTEDPGALSLPSSPARIMASSAPPIQSQAGADMQRLQQLQTEGAGLNKLPNPWLRGLARGVDIMGTVLAPGVAMAIPGTTLHNRMLQGWQGERVAQDQAAQQADLQNQLSTLDIATKQQGMAGTAKATAKAAMEGTIVRGGDGKPIAWVDDDGVTHAPGDAAIPEGVAAVMSADQGKPPTSDFELWQRQNPNGTAADYEKLKAKPLTPEQAASLNAVWNPVAAKHHLPSGQFQPGMSAADATALSGALNNAIGKAQGDVRITIDQQGQQARNAPLDTSDPAMQAAVTAVASGSMKLTDVYGRGATTAQKAQFVAAVKQVNPNFNSGDNAVENASRTYMISGQGGQTLTAGNTLTHHLDLYDKAVDAVKNGNLKLINQIGNELGIATGNDAQTNLALIRQGVAMEAARFWTGGVPGEAEINQFNKSLSGDGSPAQMHGGANTIRAMAKGKLQGLQGQAEAGSQGQANFGNVMAPPPIQSGRPAGATHTVMGSDRKLHYTDGKNDLGVVK